ncbi:YncE family protein [Candidatus Latescibacterota bacterium]
MKHVHVRRLFILPLILLMVLTTCCIFDDENKGKGKAENIGDSDNGIIVITTSVWGESGNTAVYNLETKTFTDNVLPIYQDNFAKTDGKYLYILERSGSDAISKYDPSLISEGSHIFQYSVGELTNPHDIIFSDSKAYLLLYGSDKIWVVNPDAVDEKSFKTGEIDISQWADADGSPEAHIGFMYGGMVYVILQMYDLTSFSAGTPVLLKIDPVTDTIIDMVDKKDGIQGVNLIIKNISMGSLLNNTMYLAGTTYGISDEGVIKVDLDDPVDSQRKILSEAALGGIVAGVELFTNDLGCVIVYDENYNMIPRYFDPVTGSLGSKLPVPDAGGGIIMVGSYLYVGATEYSNPGMYIVDPEKNETVGEMYPTELQPSSIVFIGDGI